VKAIETVYRGVLFRSRLEARWAEFFDHLDVIWEYEPEGYQLDATRYLPDFWLPYMRSRGKEGGIFFEVKPTSPTEGERHKARMLAHGSNRPVIIPSRSPSANDSESLEEYVGGTLGDWSDDGLLFARCDNCGQMDVGFYSGDEPRCACDKATFNPFHPALCAARAEFPNLGRWERAA
jgi:hypothetical protein